MREISEISTEHIDETENTQTVDVYFTDDDSEEGSVACVVCLDTGKAFYRDYIYSTYEIVTDAIKEIQASIEKPKVVVTINGGGLGKVESSIEIEIAVIDFDTNGETDETRLTQIPYSITDNRVVASYASGYEQYPGEVSKERVNQLFEIIKG